jgi:hypothetical protein
VRAESTVEVTSDRAGLRATIGLRVWDGDDLIAERTSRLPATGAHDDIVDMV